MKVLSDDFFRLEQDAPGAPCRLYCAKCGEGLFNLARDGDLPDSLLMRHVELHYAVRHGLRFQGKAP